MDTDEILSMPLREFCDDGADEFRFRFWVVGLTAGVWDHRTGETYERYFVTSELLSELTCTDRELGTVGEEIDDYERCGNRVLWIRDHDGRTIVDRCDAVLAEVAWMQAGRMKH